MSEKNNPFQSQSAYDTLWDKEPVQNPNGKNVGIENVYQDNNNLASEKGTNETPDEELEQRERNLRKKEEELRQKKNQLDQLESEIKSNDVRIDNWPCSKYPVTHHSIKEEIPHYAQPHMRRMYFLVLMTFLGFFWNLISDLSMYLVGTVSTTSLLFAAIYFSTGTFGAWKLWYRQIYYAIRDNKRTKWWTFFFFFGCHCAFAGLLFLAPGYFPSGAAGMWVITNAMGDNPIVGIFVLVNSVFWLLLFIASVFFLVQSWRLYHKRPKAEAQLIPQTVEQAADLIDEAA